MSRTYPKGADVDPAAAERERARALTRELHEAIKGAREAARELAAERARFAAAVTAEASAAAQMAIFAIDAHIAGRGDELARMHTEIIDTLTGLYDGFLKRLGELADNDLDQEGIETFMAAAVLRAVRTPEFIARVVDAVAEEIAAEPSQGVPQDRFPGGQVIVATGDQLDAFRRAGGNPGVVIDMRAGR